MIKKATVSLTLLLVGAQEDWLGGMGRENELKALKQNFGACNVEKLFENAANLVKSNTEKAEQLKEGITTDEHIL